MEKKTANQFFSRQSFLLENSYFYTNMQTKKCRKKIFDKIVSRQGNPDDYVYDDMEEEIEYGQISHNAISPAAEIDLTNFVLVLLLIFNLFSILTKIIIIIFFRENDIFFSFIFSVMKTKKKIWKKKKSFVRHPVVPNLTATMVKFIRQVTNVP